MDTIRPRTETTETSVAYGRMLDLVGALRQECGHGNWAELDRRLGHSEGYLGRVLRQEIRLTADMLLRILDVLSIEPGLFFHHVFPPSSDPSAVLELLQRRMANLRRGDGSQEADLDMATLAWLQDLQAASHRLDGTRRQVRGAAPSSEQKAFAAQLTELKGRLEAHPDEVLEQLPDCLMRVAGQLTAEPDGMCDLLARGLAIQSQVLVMGVKPRDVQPLAALHYVRVAWELARSAEARAEALVTAARLAVQVGAVQSAGWLVPRAMEAALCLHSTPMMGRALMLQGRLHVLRRDWGQGAEAWAAALPYLDEASYLARCAAHLGSARCALETGRLAAAHQALRRADSLCSGAGGPRERWIQGQCRLLQAALAETQGRWDEAADLYASVRQTRETLGHLAAALLVALREAGVLLRLARQQEVRQLTTACMGWTRPLRRQRRMCEIITDMARLALSRELTPRWLHAAEVELKPLADLHGLSGACRS